MPFCSSCGAEIKGAFCTQCGAAGAAAGAQAGAMPPQPPAAPVQPVPGAIPMPSPQPRSSGTKVLLWVLGGIVVLVMLSILGVAAVGYWFVRNPGRAISTMITAANPDVEVVDVDNAGRRITIRNRHDGKQVTLSFDDVKNGRFSLSAVDENGKVGRVELGEGAGKMPGWVPVYPGAKVDGHLTGMGDDGDRVGEGGVYSFSSADPPDQVMKFYQDKAADLGMKVNLTTATAEGGHLSAADEEDNRSLVVMVGSGSGGGTSGSVTFKRKR
jgi:hypothetical protein